MNDYGRLVQQAVEGIRENGVVDLVTQAEAGDAGYDIDTLIKDATRAAEAASEADLYFH